MLAVGLLLLANAFFVGVEFALIAASRYQVEALATGGSWRARMTFRAMRNLTFELSGAQLGISVSSLILGFLIGPVLAPYIEPLLDAFPFLPSGSNFAIATGVALAVITATQLVVGEIIPKNLAIARPVPTALALAPIAHAFNRVLKPLVWFLNTVANQVLLLVGMQAHQEHGEVASVADLRQVIRRSARSGLLPDVRLDLIERSLRFGHLTALDVLVPRGNVLDIREDATLADLAALAHESGFSRFPVYQADGDEIVGVIHVQECLREPPEAWESIPVASRLQPPLVVAPTGRLPAILLDMRLRHVPLAIVADEHGMMAGILTIEDILEEILGSIEDEYDSPDSDRPYQAAADGSILVSGLITAPELERVCGFAFPPGPYETLAGYLLLRFQRIPGIGDAAVVGGRRFQVLAMDGLRIARVRIAGHHPRTSA
ncbi:MAG: hemolysin family protein [Chloroflexota bacterium]|nr:hemolysin family protein [Chloroflexota bacterium]MDP6508185.1 hemolysin family protein [Chloroflexota bacterium]